MTLSIRWKVFLVLVAATTVAAAGMLVFVRWSLERGLVEYVAHRDEQRIQAISERLGAVYGADGGWDRLRSDRGVWLAALLGNGERAGRRGRWLRARPGRPANEWPPRHVEDPRPRPEGRTASPRPPPMALRLMLVDAAGGVIYGRESLLAGTRRFPVRTNGAVVGHLALLPGPPPLELGEVRLLERQRFAVLVIAGLVVTFCAVLALTLTGPLVRPLLAFQQAARALAAGRYDTRLPARGDDELGRLARDLNGLAAALERNEQARRRWVADISHELRTPLSVMRGELEALQDGVRPLDRAAVDSLHADAGRLGRLVDDLNELSMTDLGALSYRMTDVDPMQVLADDVAALAPRFERAGLELTVTDDRGSVALVRGDPQRLSQLHRNLLENSLRYTDEGGGLIIRSTLEGDRLVLDFRDTAPGVPGEALARLFERLYRAEGSRSRRTGGAGLGLAICQNIVTAHGGEIEARTAPEGGLWIQVRLPVTGAASG